MSDDDKHGIAHRDAIHGLIACAKRVDVKYGTHDDGTPKDWHAWTDLRDAITEMQQFMDPTAMGDASVREEEVRIDDGSSVIHPQQNPSDALVP